MTSKLKKTELASLSLCLIPPAYSAEVSPVGLFDGGIFWQGGLVLLGRPSLARCTKQSARDPVRRQSQNDIAAGVYLVFAAHVVGVIKHDVLDKHPEAIRRMFG